MPSPKKLLPLVAIPISLALAAFLNATAVSALVEGTLAMNSDAPLHQPILGSTEIAKSPPTTKTAAKTLKRNVFDHAAPSLRQQTDQDADDDLASRDPAAAPTCEGVRPLIVVGDEDQSVAFAALEYAGKRILRRRGGEVGEARVAYVGRDRVWLEGHRGICQALLFAPSSLRSGSRSGAPAAERTQTSDEPAARSALETEIGRHIAKTGPDEYTIDRTIVDRIVDAQQELFKARLAPERSADGDRVIGLRISGIKPGSLASILGIENGDRLETINGYDVSNFEKMMEAYGRLRAGADKLQIHLTRAGKQRNLDYSIR